MIHIECPHCGLRNSSEFRYGGEYNPRLPQPLTVSNPEWTDYIYFRDNKLGEQIEWWYHSNGCGTWFLAERHTKSNKVLKTYLWSKQAEGEDE
ncbi:MAG: sarcosine oxidase subunit delta [Chloroflexota bacterium]|jgi:sarcosine oxidase, subunit delta